MIKEYNGSTWQGKAYSKIVDTTQQVTTFPVVVRPMDDIIPSWTIKGNMVQDGTPSPSNIIYPSETGDRTGNLFDMSTVKNGKGIATDGSIINYEKRCSTVTPIDVSTYSNVTLAFTATLSRTRVIYALFNDSTLVTRQTAVYSGTTIDVSSGNKLYICFYDAGDTETVQKSDLSNVMLNSGSTALPYEPYGVKIPISSANTTTPVYLGEVETARKIGKQILTGTELVLFNGNSTSNRIMVVTIPTAETGTNTPSNVICTHFETKNIVSQTAYGGIAMRSNGIDFVIGIGYDVINVDSDSTPLEVQNAFKAYLAAQYAAGTPVTVWYVLSSATTGILNEPIRKIGDYADSVSGTNLSVTAHSPTTIDVLTTLKPSEMDLTYTGTKMCGRKRKSANLCDTDNPNVYRGYYNSNTGKISAASTNAFVYIPIEPNTKYYFSGLKRYNANEKILLCTTASVPNNGVDVIRTAYLTQMTTSSITTTSEERFIALYLCGDADYTGYGSVNAAITANVSETMINTGSSALPYVPYWK